MRVDHIAMFGVLVLCMIVRLLAPANCTFDLVSGRQIRRKPNKLTSLTNWTNRHLSLKNACKGNEFKEMRKVQ